MTFRHYLRPTAFVDAPFGHDGKVARLAGGMLWFAAIERVTPGAYEIFNLGGTGTISLAELVTTIERIVGKPAKIERQPDQPGDVPLTFANVDKARAMLGYEPTTPPEVGIARFWDWRQRRPMP